MAKRKKIKRKVRVKQKVELVHKNDKTRVHRNSGDTIPRMEAQMPRTVAPVFKVKLRRKQ